MGPTGDTEPSSGEREASAILEAETNPDGPGESSGAAGSAGPGEPADSLGQQPELDGRKVGFAWFFCALAGFVIGQIGGTVVTLIAASLAGDGSQLTKIAALAEPPDWYVASSLVGIWTGFLAGPVIASKLRGSGRFLRDFGLRFRPIDALGIVIGLASQAVIALAYEPFRHVIHNFTAPSQKLTGATDGWGFVVIAILTVVGAPLFEELFFRGLLFSALQRIMVPDGERRVSRRRVGIGLAAVADGLLFGLAHGEWAQLAGLALFGVVLSLVYLRTGRLGMCIVAHGAFNLAAVVTIIHSRGGIGL